MDTGDEGWGAIENILNYAAVLMAFEQIGGAEASLNMAKEYALDRYASVSYTHLTLPTKA